ncbi:ChrR family anti-sigma-E factor [Shewanella sp. 1CM18E]|uniref:ChrR family anti-sigma-E factor n=1 Tax=Shewanella sp. 1CM18E TaxID=2929169 RepID=UPI0020BF9382|nr:ChrR family anti-sigma-E factor [Shewanella sp. 1CM18E]MCK8045556.1 ChrR family anti-sigma-E factor [Shewanella sp. 1CM18E]
MIKFHPKDEMLMQHAKGLLHLGLSTAVSAHCELCSVCRGKVNDFTEQLAEECLGEDALSSNSPKFSAVTSTATGAEGELDNPEYGSIDFSAMLNQITNLAPAEDEPTLPVKPIVEIKGNEYLLPKAFSKQANLSWSGFGKISRMRLDADDGHSRASLLHIDANGEIPEHTHNGREITLLLEGYFEDEFSQYVPGDFIELDGNHQHSPKTMNGCLCYTVVDAPLHFTKGISKILNPVGELIY